MSCPIASRAERRRADKRTRVLDRAEAMFTSSSYAAVRIEEVAAAADISVGTVYNYFGGKEGLYLAVAERVLDRVEEHLAPAYEPNLGAAEAVALLGKCYLRALVDNPIACRSLVTETDAPEGDLVDGTRKRVSHLYDEVAWLIDRGIAEGAIAPMDSDLAARLLIGSWNGVFASTFQTLGPQASVEEVTLTLELATDLLARGMTCAVMHPESPRDTAR